MKQGIKAYFSFTRKERIGILVLTGLLLILVIVRAGMHLFVKQSVDLAQQERLAATWENYKKTHTDTGETKAVYDNKTEGVININTADSLTLTQLKGIGPVNAVHILQYRKNYGPFTDMEQIRALCTIPGTTFNELKAHISLSDEPE